jgi:predicted nucleic acid-binding protein
VIAVDTSVVVAGFASWHEGHESASAVLANAPRLPAHVAIESYSVLTRLPPPHRAAADVVGEFLRARFSDSPLTLPGAEQESLLKHAIDEGIIGGAIYDALVGATARHAGAILFTRDRRAIRVYETIGVAYELVE